MGKFRNVKIYVRNATESEAVQRVLFENECHWYTGHQEFSHINNSCIYIDDQQRMSTGHDIQRFDRHPYREKKVEQILKQINEEHEAKEKPLFADARVGDSVYHEGKGYGKISHINERSQTPLTVNFENSIIVWKFRFDGKEHKGDINQTLYWTKPTITGGTTPPKRTRSVGGYEYPEPLRGNPSMGDTVYYPSIHGINPSYICTTWKASDEQVGLQNIGMIHTSAHNAKSHARAMARLIGDAEKKG